MKRFEYPDIKDVDKSLKELHKKAILISLNEYSNGNLGVPVKISKIVKRASRIFGLFMIKKLEEEGIVKVEGNTIKQIKKLG